MTFIPDTLSFIVNYSEFPELAGKIKDIRVSGGSKADASFKMELIVTYSYIVIHIVINS